MFLLDAEKKSIGKRRRKTLNGIRRGQRTSFMDSSSARHNDLLTRAVEFKVTAGQGVVVFLNFFLPLKQA